MADFPRWPRLPFGINLEGALTKVETWANRLVDTLAADNVRLRRSCYKKQFGFFIFTRSCTIKF